MRIIEEEKKRNDQWSSVKKAFLLSSKYALRNHVCCQHLIKRQIYKKRERALDRETDKREESLRNQQVRVRLLQGVVEQLIN